MDARSAAVAAGYQVSGNNIFRLPGVEILPCGPGQLETFYGQSIRAIGAEFVVYSHTFTPNGDGFGRYDHYVIARFDSLEALYAWLTMNGRLSEPGQPAGVNNVWD